MALEDREARITAVAESVETDMELLGATAVEDKLQVWQGVSWWGQGGRHPVCGVPRRGSMGLRSLWVHGTSVNLWGVEGV